MRRWTSSAIVVLLVAAVLGCGALKEPPVPTAAPVRTPTQVVSATMPLPSPTLPATPTPGLRPTVTLAATVPRVEAPAQEDGSAPTNTSTPAPVVLSPPPTTATLVPPTRPPGLATWEGELTLMTYGWQEALVPTEQGDPVYPYPRLDFGRVGPPAPRTYRAIYLQNAYVQLIVLPELGGRILRWKDLTTGRQLAYANPVIKPTRWGIRGWWLATGGIEWAFPTEEHGLNEYRPWQAERLADGVRLWDTDDRTGLTVEVTLRLDRDHNYVTVVPRITNPTGETRTFQFWANAMLTLGDGNAPSPALVFALPDDAVTVHSTGDPSLPGPGGTMAWPFHSGRDFSRYAEWRHYLGVFANPAAAGFVGAYDLASDQGLVRTFPHAVARGVKLFCPGDLDPGLWTDDSSRYFELWGGLTATFWEYATLQPGGSISWTERWYPVSGIGGLSWANEHAAIRLTPAGDRAEVTLVTTEAQAATVVLRRGGADVARWRAIIAPGQPFRASGGPTAGGGEWGVQLWASDTLLAQMGP